MPCVVLIDHFYLCKLCLQTVTAPVINNFSFCMKDNITAISLLPFTSQLISSLLFQFYVHSFVALNTSWMGLIFLVRFEVENFRINGSSMHCCCSYSPKLFVCEPELQLQLKVKVVQCLLQLKRSWSRSAKPCTNLQYYVNISCVSLFHWAIWTCKMKHDDVIKWKHFPHYRSPVNSPHKGQWRGALMFSLICAWINGWVNNCDPSDLRRHCAHYDVTAIKAPEK